MEKSSQKGLILAFIFITSVIIFLWIISLFSMRESSKALDNVLQTSRSVRLAKEGTINMAMAGQLPKEIETITADLGPIRYKLNTLRTNFFAIKAKFEEKPLINTAHKLVNEFLLEGEKYYQAMELFFPIREQMALYVTQYKGESRTLMDVLSEREIDHVRYVRALRQSVEQGRLLVGTLDFRQCGFYKWHQETPLKHADIKEIITDEMHPLHKKLHDYAAEIGVLLANGRIDQAEDLLKKADDNLNRLGTYFSGLRSLAHVEQLAAQESFSIQLVELRNIYERAALTAKRLEDHLFNVELQPALTNMEKTTTSNRLLIWLASILGTLLSIIVAVVTVKKVRNRTNALVNMTAALEKANNEIVINRNKLQEALDAVSSLIQNVARNQNFDTRFENPSLAKCYEVLSCQQESCPCFGRDPMRCWQIVGTLCLGKTQGSFAQKFGNCYLCPVFQKASFDPLYEIGEHFNNMMTMLEAKNKEIEILSITDMLTGLFNRRGFIMTGAQQLQLTQRIDKETLLLYADLDDLKWINDNLGHEVGDKAIQETADIFRDTFRTSDIVGRIGGDEFAILFMCNTKEFPESKEIIIDRINKIIKARNSREGQEYKLSVSFGFAKFDQEKDLSTIDQLLSAADKLMYQNKQKKKEAQQKKLPTNYPYRHEI